jgi:tricorn protease
MSSRSPPRVSRSRTIPGPTCCPSARVDGPAAAPLRRLAAGAIDWVSELAAAPDGSAVAVAARDGRLFVVDASSGEVTELASSDNGEITGLAWSPDSAWLAWSHPGPEPLRQLRMIRLAGPDRTAVNVTDGRFTDTDPVFTADGKYLAFLSVRSFDPVYDAQVFDLSFPYGWRPYLVPLAAATPSPFAPLPGGRPVGGHHDDHGQPRDASRPEQAGSDESAAGDRPDGADRERDDARAPVTVDAEGLASRIVQVPVAESRYASLHAVKGGLAWLKEPVTGNLGEGGAKLDDAAPRPSLEHFDLEAQRCTELTGELDWFEASGDGSVLVVSDHGKLSVVPADRKPDPDNPADRVTVDKSRARYLADPAALWRNAYTEAGRYARHEFWVPDLADVDWDGVLETYRPLLDRIAGARDFADLMWEVFGELGTSHAYVVAADHDDDDRDPGLGLLGADLERDPDGRWTVGRVLPGESSDPRARSPLATPGAQVAPGDTLLAVDGTGPGPVLIGAAGKPVELTIGPASGGEARRAVVITLKDDRRLRYQDWVAGRRQRVRELSDGRVGYLHIPNMVSGGWADFHRDLHTEMVRDALVVDLRGNSGGHTSQLVLEKLARRVVGWSVPRRMQPQTYPQDAPRGPMVALIDEFAGSDGDIVTAAIKTLGIGPVVGTRTWGGVIGYDGRHQLVDGTAITAPGFAMWLDGYGWAVENHGVDPDAEVVPSPDDYAAGRDPQLEAAVRMALGDPGHQARGHPRSHLGPAVQAPAPAAAPSRSAARRRRLRLPDALRWRRPAPVRSGPTRALLRPPPVRPAALERTN